MKKINPFRAKKSKMAGRFAKRFFKSIENMFFMVFEVADSDYGIDFCLFLKTKKFQKLLSPPLNPVLFVPNAIELTEMVSAC